MNVKVNIQELHYILDHTPADQNIMLTGRHGIGKSEILKAYFEKKGMPVVALFLGQMSDPGDLIGLPDKSGEKTVFRPPYWFPMDNEPVVLFLDELNRARPEILQAVMDLTLNRTLAGRRLPEGSRVISAVNEGIDYQLTDLDPALVSRFNVVAFQPSVEEWLLWAKQNMLDMRVVGFIQQHAEWLDTDPTLPVDADTGLDKMPDRRAWKRVSDVMRGIQQIGPNDVKLITSIVGAKAGKMFVSSLKRLTAITAGELFEQTDKVLPMVADMELHELAILNEDIFQYLQVHDLDKEEMNAAGRCMLRYVEVLKEQNKMEVMANFASMLTNPNYEKAVNRLAAQAPRALMELMSYVAKIR